MLIESATVPDHAVKLGRQTMHLRELSYEQLQEIGSKTMVPDWIRPDLDLLITVGRFWGADAVKRFRFVEAPERHEPSMMETLLDRFRTDFADGRVARRLVMKRSQHPLVGVATISLRYGGVRRLF